MQKNLERNSRVCQISLLQQGPKIGDAIACQSNQWLIFNLITKSKYWQKPTFQTFTASIVALKEGMGKSNSDKLAIPLLGAGLDRLSLAKNRGIIQEVFSDTNVDILVCKI